MNSIDRRREIVNILSAGGKPQKGSSLSEKFGVTRQVIVKDIAILRAEGKEIIATPEGYLIPREEKHKLKRILAVCHREENIEDELVTVIKYGGVIIDVIIEHPLYGEMKGMLMIKTLYDLQNFMNKLNDYKAEPLLVLTGGVHIHTIEADSEEAIENIEKELKEKGYLLTAN